MNGSSRTLRICLAIGIARELAELREKTRWVLNSAKTKRGKVASIVVRRCPCSETESARTCASKLIGTGQSPNRIGRQNDGESSRFWVVSGRRRFHQLDRVAARRAHLCPWSAPVHAAQLDRETGGADSV